MVPNICSHKSPLSRNLTDKSIKKQINNNNNNNKKGPSASRNVSRSPPGWRYMKIIPQMAELFRASESTFGLLIWHFVTKLEFFKRIRYLVRKLFQRTRLERPVRSAAPNQLSSAPPGWSSDACESWKYPQFSYVSGWWKGGGCERSTLPSAAVRNHWGSDRSFD